VAILRYEGARNAQRTESTPRVAGALAPRLARNLSRHSVGPAELTREERSMNALLERAQAGPFVWRGSDLGRAGDWIHPLSAGAIAEVHAAMRGVRERGLGWREVRKEDFPLPGFSAELARVSDDLEWGRGLGLLRGLPIERYSDDELHTMCWGI